MKTMRKFFKANGTKIGNKKWRKFLAVATLWVLVNQMGPCPTASAIEHLTAYRLGSKVIIKVPELKPDSN
jgi:hypothetical protein